MSRLMRAYDWSASPLGPPDTWPQQLRSYLNVALTSRQPMFIGWTRDMISFYNDAYRAIVGEDKHPWALGTPLPEVFGNDAYPLLKPVFDALLDRGEPYASENALVPLYRYGYLEECYFDFSYTPIFGEHRQVEGLFVACTDVTDRVLNYRRTRTLAGVSAALASLDVPGGFIEPYLTALTDNPQDLPFVRLYLRGSAHDELYLEGEVGLDAVTAARLDDLLTPYLHDSADHLLEHFGGLETEHRPEPVTQIMLLPLQLGRAGVLAVGLNPLKRFDEPYRIFLQSLREHLALALERADSARRLQQSQRELQSRNAALEGFADLARDLAFETDPYVLVRYAQERLLELLPSGCTLYYEPEGNFWRLRSQVGDLANPQLQAQIDQGLPLHQTRSLWEAWQSGRPHYQEMYDREPDNVPWDAAVGVGAVAVLPVQGQSGPRGILSVVLRDRMVWSPADRAVIEIAVSSLAVALDRSRAVAALTANQQQLREANAELEAFASSIAHDLRAPVRHIASFATLLQRRLEGSGDAQVQRYLSVIEASAVRMEAMIHGMLDFSRLGQRALQISAVDLNVLVDAVQHELATELEGRRVTWQVAPLPTVQADPGLLHQVLINLLSNALKYTRKRDEARIQVWSEEVAEAHIVHVRDNGVGFDPKSRDRLFGVFQRLHHDEEFEGTGVGLANVRRIVTRHGGQVWAEGATDQGATFSFSLPRPARK